MKRIALLGSTGSVGQAALRVVRKYPNLVQIDSLACHSNSVLLQEQIREFRPRFVAVHDEKAAQEIRALFPDLQVFEKEQGVCDVCRVDSTDLVVMAIVGLSALRPTFAAIEACKDLALASKEVVVSAGELLMQKVREKNIRLFPLDSEHNALFQLLEGKRKEEVKRLILTASGGPFFTRDSTQLKHVTLSEALKHPTWKMGKKITVDCSTLMNKGFEVIEACWLFDLPPEKVDVVIHPQSLVHSFVEMVDGTLFAHMYPPSMEVPIQHALLYPDRKPGVQKPFSFIEASKWEFFEPDTKRFPCLQLAFSSIKKGGSVPCFLNAANEVLVEQFLQEKISWIDISRKLSLLIEKHQCSSLSSLEEVQAIDQLGRERALEV